MGFFMWIATQISSNGDIAVWVVGSPGVTSQRIKKHILNFESKVWWALSLHRIFPTIGDNVLSLVRVAMIVDFIDSYDFDIGEILAQEIRDRDVGGDKSLLVYHYMITLL